MTRTENLGPPGPKGNRPGQVDDARGLADALGPGATVAHYEIVSKLGSGGMGVVYRARDLNLGREAALKRPRERLAPDSRRRKRFDREARAASSLQHPHIVTVFEGFEEGGYSWLAMELIDGDSLSRYLEKRGALSTREVLRHGEGLADALRVAHARHIVHRDIKPSNVLIDENGLARLTDFGLAHFEPPSEFDSRTPTRTGPLTETGQLMGTVAYMSPEQALGKTIDGRSDIFSLGCVLYEMCTGVPAFGGEKTQGEILVSILHEEPEAIRELNPEIPVELERVVAKCLAKRPDERYQSAVDLLTDLRAERRRVQSSQYSQSHSGQGRAPAGWQRLWQTSPIVKVVAAAAALALLTWLFWPEWKPPKGHPRRVTDAPGWEADVAVSPDGTSLAYASDEVGDVDVWMVDILGGTALRLTDHPADDRKPAWFPDGSAVAFSSNRSGETDIWKVPRFGGSATMLVPGGDDPAISPDGSKIAFTKESRIAVADLDRLEEVRVLTGPGEGSFNQIDPAWSPNGRQIAYSGFDSIWVVPAEGGPARRLTSDAGGDREPAWSEDGKRIYFASSREGTRAIWWVPASGGEPQRLTMGTGPESHPSLSRDGRILGYSTFVRDLDVKLVDRESGETTRLQGQRREWGATLAPDGSALVYVSNRGIHSEDNLWLQRLDGLTPVGEPVRLNEERAESSNPAYSPDGRWIAYQRREGTDRNIWVIPSSGGVPHALTSGPGVRFHPAWSPDGTRLAYVEDKETHSELWVVGIDDGRVADEPRRLDPGELSLMWPDWSSDGLELTFVGAEEQTWEVWVLAVDGGEPASRVTTLGSSESGVPVEFFGANFARWDRTGTDLLVSGLWGGHRISLRQIDPDTGESRPLPQLISFGAKAVFGQFNLSPDGAVLALTFEEERGDLWVLESRSVRY